MTQPPSTVEPTAEPTPGPSNSKLDDEDNTIVDTHLIREIQKHPILYENAQKEKEEKKNKRTAWVEVCKTLFKDWDNFPPLQKRDTIKDVKKIWIKLKEEYFKRQEQNQPDSPGSPASKKSKTIFDLMSLLLEPTDAQDLDGGAYSHTNFAPILNPVPVGEMQLPLIPPPALNIGMPSTSNIIERTPNNIDDRYNEIIPFADMVFRSMMKLTPEHQEAAKHEIMYLLERRKHEGLKLQILQNELVYPPGMEPVQQQADVAPEELTEEPAGEEERYSPSHGRPKDADGQIVYPETDPEDEY